MSADIDPVENIPVAARPLSTGKHHISPSEFQQWSRCTWAHKRAQVDRVDKYRPSPTPTFGTAVHEAQESFLKTRVMDVSIAHVAIDRLWDRCGFKDPQWPLANGMEGPAQDPLQVFLAAQGMTLEEAIRAFDFGPKSRKAAHADADLILPEVPAFMDATFQNWHVVAAEMQLYEPIGDTAVHLKGFIDGVLVATGKRGEILVWIIDWKTSAWGWRQEKKQDPIVQSQLALYKRYWMQKCMPDTLKPANVRCGFVLLKRSAKPGMHCELVPVSVGDVSIQRVDRQVLNMIASVRHGIAVKNRGSCTYCDYNKECSGTWADHQGKLHQVSALRRNV